MTDNDFDALMELVVHGFEVAGSARPRRGRGGRLRLRVAQRPRGPAPRWPTSAYDEAWGAPILLGLELLIIADIVLTITVDPTLESALALGLIVVVRTFLQLLARGGARRHRCPGVAASRDGDAGPVARRAHP